MAKVSVGRLLVSKVRKKDSCRLETYTKCECTTMGQSQTNRSPAQSASRPNLLDGHRLGEVPGLVDVAAPEHGHVIAEQLHGDDREDGLQRVHRLGHLRKREWKRRHYSGARL